MNWDEIAADYLAVAHEVLTEMQEEIRAVSADIVACVQAGNKVMFCGNGGSAADAQHFSGEFLNRFLVERDPFPGITLTADTSTLTAIGNDYGFDEIFAKQVKGLGKRGDVLVGISSSGNSANILRAVETAQGMGITSVALTGGEGGKVAALADRVLCVSCTAHTPRVQEGQHLIMHLICEDVEAQLAAAGSATA